MTALRILTMNDRWASGTSGMLLVTSWLAFTGPDLDASYAEGQAFLASQPEGYATLAIVHNGVSMPSAELRKAAAERTRSSSAHVRVNATVLEGDGFWASTARMVLSSVHLVSNTKNMYVSGSVRDAAEHLVNTLGSERLGGDVPALAAAIAAFRTEHQTKHGKGNASQWAKSATSA